MRIVKAVIALSALAVLSGCATPTHMAFSDEAEPSKTPKPVYLMTATIRNAYKPSFQPKVLVVNVERAVVKDSADRLNFIMDAKAKNESNTVTDGNTYLLRLELEQGEYVIRGLTSLAQSFPINGFYFAPMHAKLQSTQTGIYYLGHVEATVRERKGDEFKAGPSIPLIDQAIAGASGGTFDIEISDQWDKDEPKFRGKFPALNGVTVQKAILPSFDRATAQKWWETQ